MVKNYEPISRLKRFFYLWRLYRLVNTLLKKRIAERDTFGVDFSELPESNRKVTIVTIAFNNDKVLRHQINHIREHWHDSDIEYIVADNSPTVERQEAIRAVCEELNVSYMNIPKSPKINKISGSYSHGAAAMWVYYNYIVKRKPYIFGFIDHDLFPIKSFSMVEKMSDYSCYGYKMERGSAWYLWMGLIFLKSTFVNNFDINFLPCKVDKGEVYLDTGGSLWYTLYSKINSQMALCPSRIQVPMFVGGKRHRDPVDYIDDCWMHTNNGSNWKNIEDKHDMVKVIWEKYQDTIPNEIHF